MPLRKMTFFEKSSLRRRMSKALLCYANRKDLRQIPAVPILSVRGWVGVNVDDRVAQPSLWISSNARRSGGKIRWGKGDSPKRAVKVEVDGASQQSRRVGALDGANPSSGSGLSKTWPKVGIQIHS